MRILSLATLALFATSSVASAHISVTSGPAPADKSTKVVFGIGHGCHIMTPGGEVDADTYKVRIEIPVGVTGVRVLASDFGKPSVEKTATEVTAVSWQKPLADLQAGDIAYYELTIRARMPAAAFTQLDWKIYQTCRLPDGTEQTVEWVDPPSTPDGNPVAQLALVPARISGWNKFTLPRAVAATDYAKYFGDAAIVWRGNQAYSPNGNIAALIAMTPGVEELTGDLASGDELWVKY